MIHEFRNYQVKTGMMVQYLDAFERLALPAIRRHMNLLSFWTSDIGDLNQVFHLWEFESHQHRQDSYVAMRSDPQYRDEFIPVALPLIEAMRSTILTPTEFARHLPLIQGR